MIKVIKLKPILMLVGILLAGVLLSIGIVSVVNTREIPKSTYTIVIDAGHGARCQVESVNFLNFFKKIAIYPILDIWLFLVSILQEIRA